MARIEGMPYCQPCPEGYTCEHTGTVTPEICPAGYYCGDNNTSPEPCPIGTYSNETGLGDTSECKLCAPGRYCAGLGLQEPTGECLAGWFCEAGAKESFGEVDETTASGRRRVLECPAGAYCIEGAEVPIACPQGTYCSGNNSNPWPCESGTYNMKTSQSSCEPCPAGFDCSPGGVVDYANGTFYATMGLNGCSHAAVLAYHTSSGAALGGTLVACETLSYGADFVCPEGHYCEEGLVNLADGRCPIGTYSNHTGLANISQCMSCPPGMYCNDMGMTAPSGPCQAGYYCSGGAAQDLSLIHI